MQNNPTGQKIIFPVKSQSLRVQTYEYPEMGPLHIWFGKLFQGICQAHTTSSSPRLLPIVLRYHLAAEVFQELFAILLLTLFLKRFSYTEVLKCRHLHPFGWKYAITVQVLELLCVRLDWVRAMEVVGRLQDLLDTYLVPPTLEHFTAQARPSDFSLCHLCKSSPTLLHL